MSFPAVRVVNSTGDGFDESNVPKPDVTVNRKLQTDGDYAFLGGTPPDERLEFAWSWKSEVGHVNDAAVADEINMEARSAIRDGESHDAEFTGGILLGVAAAALIVAVQEFVNRGTQVRTDRSEQDLQGSRN